MNSPGPAVQCRHLELAAIVDELHALDHVRLPARSLTDVRAVQIRRVVQRIERLLPYHVGHGERTAGYAFALGQALDLPHEELRDLHFAALLHDIGLLTVPRSLLRKEGALTAEEYVLVQSHPRAGAALLEPIPFLREAAILIAHHHERWDGYGYPYGVRGDFIPLGARILAIADTFDTLVAPHWNGRGHDMEAALCLLRLLAGSQLDPNLVAVFVQITQTVSWHPTPSPPDGLPG